MQIYYYLLVKLFFFVRIIILLQFLILLSYQLDNMEEAINTSLDMVGGEMNMAVMTSFPMGELATTYLYGSIGMWIITYILIAIGLYLINKKLKEKNPWIAFIPIVQIWSYFQASQKPFLEYFVYPVLAMVVWALLAPWTWGLTALAATIYFLVMWVKLLHAISLRLGRWTWTTILLFFFPIIMLPYLGIVMKEK